MLPYLSLDAATAAGPGAVLDLGRVESEFTLAVFTTGSPSTCNVVLQGSHDGENWAGISGPASVGLNNSNSGFLVRYVRADCTALSGGTSPTVTATIAAAGGDDD
jgi:hypothetical protein